MHILEHKLCLKISEKWMDGMKDLSEFHMTVWLEIQWVRLLSEWSRKHKYKKQPETIKQSKAQDLKNRQW